MIPKVDIPTESQDILKAISGKGFIAGGYARWIATHFSKPNPSDIDIFHYRNTKFFYKSVGDDEFELKSEIADALSKLGYRVTRDLPNAVEIKMQAELFNEWVDVKGFYPIQLIKPFTNTQRWGNKDHLLMKTFGTPDEVLSMFDFPISMAALEHIGSTYSETDVYRLIVDERFWAEEEQHKLSISHINCPVAVSMRAIKYVSKGYSIRSSELIKLFKDWDGRPTTYKSRLIELCEKDNLDASEWFELEKLLRID